MAERQVAPERIQRVQERQAPGVVDRTMRAEDIDTSPSKTHQFVTGLMDAVKGISPVVDHAVKRKVELDTITQQQRFYEDLEPTDDATGPGLRAYNTLKARESVTASQNKLLQDLEFDPDMSDEEFEKKSRDIYSGAYQEFEGDPLMTEALTALFTQTQPGIVSQRTKLREQHRYGQRVGAFTSSLSETIDATSTPEELRESITMGALRTEADALRIHTGDMVKAVWDRAKADAKDADNRLLEAMRGIPAFAESEDFELLEKTYNGAKAVKDRIDIGSLTADVEAEWVTGNATWAETESRLKDLGDRWPGRISEEYTRSLKLKGLKKREEAAGAARVLDAFGSDYPFRINQAFTNKEKIAGAKELDSRLAEWTNIEIAKGRDPGEVQVQAFNEKFKYTAASGVPVGDIGKQLKFLANQSPDRITETPDLLPTYSSLLRSIRNVERGTLSLYVSGKELEVLETYKDHAGTYGDEQAWRMAWTTVHDPTPITPEVKKDFDKQVEQKISDTLDYNLLDNWFGGMKDLSDRQRQDVHRDVLQSALSLYQGGARTVESAVRGAMENYNRNNTPLSNGTVVRGDKNRIAEAAQVAPEAVPFLWERYFIDNEAELAEAAGVEELDYEEVTVQTTPNGLWHLRGPFGVMITPPQPLEELSQYAVDADKLMTIRNRSMALQRSNVEIQQQLDDYRQHMRDRKAEIMNRR